VAWTTTPWTLPANLAVCVNPEFEYWEIEEADSKDHLILAACRVKEFYKKEELYTVVKKMLGKELEGRSYIPLFDYFEEKRRKDGCFRVLCGDFVTADEGTGVVHIAPAYGEEDYALCVKTGIITRDNPENPIDDNGYFLESVTHFKGRYIKEADDDICKHLREKGRLLSKSKIKHRYPFCWRSNTPLIYKAVKTWFIEVTRLKE